MHSYNKVAALIMKQTGMNTFLVLLLTIQMCSTDDDKGGCEERQDCLVLEWREWESCHGNCKYYTDQIRKKSICFNPKLVSPSSRENVIKFCNITQPTLENRPCPICSKGVYSDMSQKCELCDYTNCSDNPCKNGTCKDTMYGMQCSCHPGYTGFDCGKMIPKQKTQHELYEFPSWFHFMEYGILTLISLTIIMTVGCVCHKCCKLCGCSPFDDDDDDDDYDEQRLKRKKKN